MIAPTHDPRVPQPAPAPTPLLVASGKGGVGTSVVAALHALAAAERGDRVLLIDANEGGGSLHHLFGARPTHSLWMLCDPRAVPEDLPIAIDHNLTLVAGGTSGAAVAPATDAERRDALKRLAELYAQYDVVVIDGGSRLDTISAISEVSNASLLLVTSADRLALAANYALVKSVTAKRNDAPIALIANRHGEGLAQEACDFLVGACSHFLARSIDVVSGIPDDPCLQAAIGAGMTIRDALDGSPAADAVRVTVQRLLPSQRAASQTLAMSAASTVAPPLPLPTPLSRRWS